MKRIVFAITVLFIAISANAITVDDYIASLERIQSLLAGGQTDAARSAARALTGARIDHPTAPFQADDALLGAIANAKKIDVRVPSRLAATIAELRRVNPGPHGQSGDPKLLEKIAKEQRARKPGMSGELSVDEVTGPPMVRFAEAIGRAIRWLAEKIVDFFEWLGSFWPKSKPRDAGTASMGGIVTGVAILIAIIVAALAWTAIRRSRAAKPELVESIAPVASARDEDPLSRASNEWERYAIQLEAAGRLRESIRAWYHAVLVTLYGAAILHFRKGRTNWEYIATLPPALPWRRDFIDLTRRFELEWYGLTESTPEAHDDCRARARDILAAVARASRGAA
jgi:hypothetical protein